MSRPPQSETVSKKTRRGRPRVFSEKTEAVFNSLGLFAENGTRRGMLNVFYRQRALGIVSKVEGLEWLASVEALKRGEKAWRPLILAELGRIDDADSLIAIARQVCEVKPSAKAGAQMVRQWRLGASKPGDVESLTMELCRTLDDYGSRHPGTTSAQFRAAAENLLSVIGRCDSDQG